jgi:hypothetical protein
MLLPLILLLATPEPIPMPTCAGTEECEVRWGRALRWVLDHNPVLVEQTDTLITTAPPQPSGANFYQVSRIAEGGGRYSFDIRVGCANDLWGCKWKALKRDFTKTVMRPTTLPTDGAAAQSR